MSEDLRTAVPPWIDLDALSRVLGYAAAETLCWAGWQGPRRADGVEYPLLPAAEQEAATWARDEVLIADELRHYSDGYIRCWLTGRGSNYLAALRDRESGHE